ncbi:hypothetical protein L6452_28606 [Arctium lappa]|uniref:Uncharacterized protein n=1 Tax=Arctium lappa TaxID=4217 RepID=A0ACB8ZYX7_ARCLA|nr:hypothetical protein L6452_28606 [Arctium lappa]
MFNLRPQWSDIGSINFEALFVLHQVLTQTIRCSSNYEKIDDEYRVNMILDNLPLVIPIAGLMLYISMDILWVIEFCCLLLNNSNR